MNKNKKVYLVTSYPKSGATWFRFLLYACKYGKLEKSLDVRKYYPQITEDHIIKKRLVDKHDLFIKSHFPYMKDIPYLDKVDHCIYIVRNPFDILTSLINHYIIEGVKNVSTVEGQLKFVRKMINQCNAPSYVINPKHAAGGWSNHVNSWIKENTDIPIYLIKYEDLREDTYAVVRRMNRDLQLGFSDGNIKISCELTSFEEMKKMESDEIANKAKGMFYSEQRFKALNAKKGQFVNKGRVGNYLDVLPEDILKLGRRKYADAMKMVGYRLNGKNEILY